MLPLTVTEERDLHPNSQDMEVQSPGWKDALEEEIAIHSRILARRIPWTEEPDGLQSMESQRDTIEHAPMHIIILNHKIPFITLC